MKKSILLLFLIMGFLANAQTSKTYKKEIKKHRKHYKKEFLEEARSPFYNNKKGLKGIEFFDADETLKFTATFKRTPEAEPFDMATYSGITKPYVMYGIAVIEINGKPKRVHIYQSTTLRRMEKYKDYLFIPFKDLTNSATTYGGGRYIDIKISDIQNNKVVIDFNKCYNPWCAFSDGYNCPVPPIENHFDFEVNAGAKSYAKK